MVRFTRERALHGCGVRVRPRRRVGARGRLLHRLQHVIIYRGGTLGYRPGSN